MGFKKKDEERVIRFQKRRRVCSGVSGDWEGSCNSDHNNIRYFDASMDWLKMIGLNELGWNRGLNK